MKYAVMNNFEIVSQWFPTRDQAVFEAKSLAKWHCGKKGFNNRDQDGCYIISQQGLSLEEDDSF